MTATSVTSRLLFAVAATAALLGSLLLVARYAWPSSTRTSGEALPHDAPPAAVSARVLCTLSNDDAAASLVAGADGGASVLVGGQTWWLFGDTLFDGSSGKQIEPNALAVSDSLRPDGCPRLQYIPRGGTAMPFIQKDGSLTVWPTGGWPSAQGGFDVYTAYVYGSGPYSYSVNEIGIAHVDTVTTETRILVRRLWSDETGFPARVIHVQPVELDDEGRLRVVLHTQAMSKLLARVDPARIADAAAYEYWDGAAWSAEPGAAASLWQLPAARNSVEDLATFENGASIAWNDALGKYVALVNVGFDAVGARTADRLEGPWSEPLPWFSCLAFARPRVPACYSPQQHPSLASAGGSTIVTTISAIEPYRMHVVEISLGVAVREYRRGDTYRYGTAPPDDGWQDQGVAFYAADAPAPGLASVYEWRRRDELRYATASPGDGFDRGALAFFAPAHPGETGALMRYRPVYEWTDGPSHVLSPLDDGLQAYGYTRGGIVFFAP